MLPQIATDIRQLESRKIHLWFCPNAPENNATPVAVAIAEIDAELEILRSIPAGKARP